MCCSTCHDLDQYDARHGGEIMELCDWCGLERPIHAKFDSERVCFSCVMKDLESEGAA